MSGVTATRCCHRPSSGTLACCLLFASCQFGAGGSVADCQALLQDEEYSRAAAECDRAWHLTSDPSAGLAAARAQFELGDDEAVLAWLEPLQGAPAEATLWQLVAKAHRRQERFDEAIEAYRRSGEIHRQLEEDRQAWDRAYSMFYLSWQRADYRTAVLSAWQAYRDAVKVGDRSLEGTSLSALATALFEVGDLDTAERVLDAAIERTPTALETDHARLQMLDGLVQLRSGREELALAAFEQALAGAGEAEAGFYRSGHLNLVNTHLRREDIAAAERHLSEARRYAESGRETSLTFYAARIELASERYARALETVDEVLSEDLDPAWRWNLLYLRGRAHEGLGDFEAASSDLEAATEILDELRLELGFDELKASLQDERRTPYEALASLHARRGAPVKALRAVERAKARTFVDAFVGRSEGPPAELSERLVLDSAERALALASLLPVLSESAVVELRPVEQLVARVVDRHILVYLQSEETVWLFALGGGEIEIRELLAPSDEIELLVRRFESSPDDLELAERLGDLLLPAEVVPQAGARLEIVADDSLGRIPFSALRFGGRYLVEDFPVSYLPSLNGLVALTERPLAGEAAIVVGDPLIDLPGARREAEDVAARLAAEALFGADATSAALKTRQRSRVLHLATHAGLGPSGAWLALADGKIDTRLVASGEIGADLVVLASCSSAARRGKGLWGSLGAAFLVGGSRVVLASLWSIDDHDARRLVDGFYRHDGVRDPVLALARAQRESITAGAPASRWASFVALGPNEALESVRR